MNIDKKIEDLNKDLEAINGQLQNIQQQSQQLEQERQLLTGEALKKYGALEAFQNLKSEDEAEKALEKEGVKEVKTELVN